MDDETGWRSELSKRVDALERYQDALWNMLRDILGKTPEGEPKLGSIGLATWITIIATIVVPIVLAIIATTALK